TASWRTRPSARPCSRIVATRIPPSARCDADAAARSALPRAAAPFFLTQPDPAPHVVRAPVRANAWRAATGRHAVPARGRPHAGVRHHGPDQSGPWLALHD